MKRSLPVLLALLSVVAVACVPMVPSGTPVTVTSGLTQPWGLAFLPNEDALVSERGSARLLWVRRTGGPAVEVMRLTETVPTGEGGLLGLAVSPTYSTDGLVYAYLSTAVDNRVVRFRLGGTRQVIVSGIPRARIHNGGRLAFGRDRMLYITTGDAGVTSRAQDLGSLGGKILRVIPDGRPAPGNPFAGSRVWSYGHRNVQGLDWDLGGNLYAAEFGQNTWDEVNRIVPGGNYGWPVVEGPGTGGGRYVAPLTVFRPAEASPSGLTYGGRAVWAAALRGERLWRLGLDNAGRVVTRGSYYVGTYGRLRHVALTADRKYLWMLTGNGVNDRVLRVPLVPA
jgi:glucose/arabinose dehydrogenase